MLASAMVVQGQGHVTNQTELDLKDDVQSAKREDEPVGGPAKPAVPASVVVNSSLTTSEPTESHSSDHDAVTPPQGAPEQRVDASMTQKKTNSHVALVDNKGLPIVVDQSGNKAPEHVDTHPVPVEVQAGASLSSPPDPVAQRAVQVRTDTVVSDVKSDLVKVAATEGKNLPPAASTIDQPHAFVQSSGEQEDTSSKAQVVVPHGQYLNDKKTEHISEWWADQHGQQQGNAETRAFTMESANLPVTNGQTLESFAAASHSQTTIVPTIPASGALTSHTHPAAPVVELTPQPLASMIRSVVVDVAQPDLGHVNIRVAMMNDSVHAHFSTDRTEVGQFLINGQDRLQTTLQANGLDMGQFRVDIDRQNGGRSFQQGSFYEQGQTWSQGSHGLEKEQAQGWPDDTRSLLQGRLNVVA
ncbi:MAG: flagellar hook-length control protein FliK [Nitrospira sp.]